MTHEALDPAVSLAALFERLRSGDQEAARLLVSRYGRPLRVVLRRHLDARVRAVYDTDDALQSVWKDFFAQAAAAPSHTLSSHEDLFAFLSQIAVNKAHQAYRKQVHALKRDRKRELPCPSSVDLPDTRPTPAEAAAASDEWQRVLSRVEPQWRRALALLRDGHSHQEVAAAIGLSERTLRRVLDRVKRRIGAAIEALAGP